VELGVLAFPAEQRKGIQYENGPRLLARRIESGAWRTSVSSLRRSSRPTTPSQEISRALLGGLLSARGVTPSAKKRRDEETGRNGSRMLEEIIGGPGVELLLCLWPLVFGYHRLTALWFTLGGHFERIFWLGICGGKDK